jgi:TRAP-type transport system periplasmic protein
MQFRILLAAAFCMMSLGAIPASAQDKIKLRIGHITNLTSLTGKGSTTFAENVKALSNGTMEVEIYPSAQLGGELDMLSQVRLGSLDAALLGSGIVASIEPTFSITELPFLWKGSEAVRKVLAGPIGQKILERLDDKGIKGLAWGAWGFRGVITSNFEVQSPSSLKGRKIRIIENSLYVRTVRALGGDPVPMAWPEVYSALQQHTIDGVETNYFGMADGKLQEVCKDLAVTDHIFTATVFMMNKKRFDALSAEQQAIIIKAARTAGEVMFDGADKANQDAIALMEKGGVKVAHPDLAPFKDSGKKVQDFYAAQIGHELIDQIIAAQGQ